MKLLKLLVVLIVLLLGVLFLSKKIIQRFFSAPEIVPLAEIRVTFPEGFSNQQMTERLSDAYDAGVVSDFAKLKVKDVIAKYPVLLSAPKSASLEGFLFPDTYRFYASSSALDLAEKMLANFDVKLSATLRAELDRRKLSVYEALTMASIIEKEVQSVDDMKLVSGIFWDRIRSGQALQSCATLAYVLGENKAQYSLAETKTPSLYNTYLNPGLPPGPIANPGINAITASIFPESSNYNYFLTDPQTGKTYYASTYNEHLANKQKYLK